MLEPSLPMMLLARLSLVLLTAAAALAAGALNGQVLCLAAGGHVAVEKPHADHDGVAHCAAGRSAANRSAASSPCPSHGDDHAGALPTERHAEPTPSGQGGCVDLAPGGTLVRQAPAPVYVHHLALLALPLAAPICLSRDALASPIGAVTSGAAALPPPAELACLSGIILLI